MGNVIQMRSMPAKSRTKKGHQNSDLKKELLSRGFYVQPVGRGGNKDIDYLIVSCNPPKNES